MDDRFVVRKAVARILRDAAVQVASALRDLNLKKADCASCRMAKAEDLVEFQAGNRMSAAIQKLNSIADDLVKDR